jgi:hypothetical protein
VLLFSPSGINTKKPSYPFPGNPAIAFHLRYPVISLFRDT